ncbi:hypothetical protein KLNKPBOH_01313 [Aeromonas veronii]
MIVPRFQPVCPMSVIVDTFIAPPCSAAIETLFEDEHLLLINKPSGLLSLSGKNPQNLDSVHYRLVQDFPGCTLVHRLDFGTSGIMVVARNKAINALLCQQFSQRAVSKAYSALLCGHLIDDEGVIDAPIAKDPAIFPLMKICAASGKPARSRYQVIERLAQQIQGQTVPLSRVRLVPQTGRTHPRQRSLWRPAATRLRTGTAADAACQRAGFCPSGERQADASALCSVVLEEISRDNQRECGGISERRDGRGKAVNGG